MFPTCTQMVNVHGDGHPKCPDLTITHSVHVTKYHMQAINMYKYYVSIKIKQGKLKLGEFWQQPLEQGLFLQRPEEAFPKWATELGVAAHPCNPSTVGGQGGWINWGQELRDQPGQHLETPSLLKIEKNSWVCWHSPVIPATLEAEAGESLEPRKHRLQWAKTATLHSSLATEQDFISKTKTNTKTKQI